MDESVEFSEDIDEEVESDLTPSQIEEAVLYASDWTTETIISQLKRGNININPSFQRRDAWTAPRKSRFIESLILGLPIPQIVLAEKERGKYLVLDGKQRLITLLQFTGLENGKFNKFKLKGLDVRKDLHGKSFEDFEGEPSLRNELDQFNNHTIRSVVIRNWHNIDFLHLVFVRLNTESVKLSPQELRQALFPGEFLTFADQAAGESNAMKQLLRIEHPDFRMRDVEILVRHLGFAFSIHNYSGNLKRFLDETCEKLNKKWEILENRIKDKVDDFEQAIATAGKIFGPEHVGRKWTGQEYEPRLNRAILDVICFYFSDEKIRIISEKSSEKVLLEFQNLCANNENFKDAVERTTKSLTATFDRFKLMGEALKSATGSNFNVPDFQNNRISFDGFWS